jgi:signal transduction histidine kinase/ligand-binding sensor domain-containing protein/CheY-like chemotaxis protein
LLLLISTPGHSQTGKYFSVDEELSSSMVHDVFQDHYGLIWIATEDGLNRYDASKFTIYKKNEKKSGAVLSNFSHFVFEDSQKNLLIGFGNGLQQYDYAADAFRKISLVSEGGDSLNAFVTSAIELHTGETIIGTSGHGLFTISQEGDSFYANQISNLIPSFLITHLYEDSDQNFWVITQDEGLFCLTKQNDLLNFFPIKENPEINITSICEDSSGNLYVGSTKKGLFEYNRVLKTFEAISSDKGSYLPINTLHLIQSGDILIGTEGEGLKVFDPASKHISEGGFYALTFNFSKSKVTSILEDRSGNIWLGIYQKGVVMLPASSNNFKYIGPKSIKSNIIGSCSITSLFKDSNNFLWVGTDGDGIYKLNPNGEQKAHFRDSSRSKNVPATIMTIFQDSENNLWLGSYDKGLVRMDPETGHCEMMNHHLNSATNRITPIFSITEDQYKNLWIGTLGSGLYSLDLNTGKTRRYETLSGTNNQMESDRLHNRWINTLTVSTDRKLYIGTVDGLGCLDLKSNSFISTFSNNHILPGLVISTLYEDKAGVLWVGTSQGLVNIKPGSEQITSFTAQDGLPSNVICAMTEDTLNNLWISTNYGISKMNKETGDFVNYYAYDGLQGNEFNMRSVYSNKRDQIMFGGLNGITHFNPFDIKDEGKKLNVYFTGFYIHDQPVSKGMKSGHYEIVTLPVMEAKEFHLNHKDNSFTIEFSALEFSIPERIVYMYKVGDSDDWITMRPGTNNVTFNNLTPGEYNFRVRGRDYNTYSYERGISIIIHPPWFLSNWAKIIYFLIFSAIVLFVIQQIRQRHRTKKRMQEHIQAKQVNEEKLQFFINIAHEIRTPMTLIINPLKKLIRTDGDKERQKSYATINRSSERILHLINQLMDIQKIDKKQMFLKFHEIELVKYLKDLCLIFDEQANHKHIDLVFLHEMNYLNVWIDPDNFDKVVLNILSNALKFTPEKGAINIELLTGFDRKEDEIQDYVQIAISDSGIGVQDHEKEKIFECFYQTSEGRKIIKEGTGIGLHLTNSIVQLHHGNIWVEDNKDGPGARFVVRLPLGNKHLQADEIPGDESFILNKEHILQLLDVTFDVVDKIKTKPKTKDKILLVDDNQEILDYISNELSQDYQITTCADGNQALKFALKNLPDLIVSDVVMPEMDGVTLCQKIKQNVNINHIPIVLLTGRSREEDNMEGLGIGADAYLTKPFNIEVLKKVVQNILLNRKILKNSYSGNQQQNGKIKDVILKSPDEILLNKALDIVNRNIGNPALNVEMLCHEIGISRVHLHRKLKELTNQSTRDLIRNIRLHQAANLLGGDKHMNVSEVAYAVGFTSTAHFSSAFKEFYGEPPSVYMEVHTNNQSKKESEIS